MYTIYINDSPLYLVSQEDSFPHDFELRYTGKAKFMLQVVATLEGGSYPTGVKVTCQDLPEAWKMFKSLFRIVKAAGGAVVNAERLLCIHRRGRWDLPKGKIDPGELKSEAALREVEEETGVGDLQLGDKLLTTFHTYTSPKGKRVLKPTYWYFMTSTQDKLLPQLEEDIAEAKWIPFDQLSTVLPQMYVSLHQVVKATLPPADVQQ